MHVHLYRARKRYRALVAAVASEAAGRRPRADRLAELRTLLDAARTRATEIELAMAAVAPA